MSQKKSQENVLSIFVFGEAEGANIWWNPQVQCRTRSLALSDHGLHCNQEEWLKELKNTSPTSASPTKLLENGRNSDTSTTRESSADVLDNVHLEISSFWLHEAWFQKMSGEQRSPNSSNIIPMPPMKCSKVKEITAV